MANGYLPWNELGMGTFLTDGYPLLVQAWDLLAVCNGVLCGFVAITAGCHVLEPWAAIIDGICADIVFELVCIAFLKLKIDDPLSAAPMHGFAGMTGLIMVGFLAKREYIYQVYSGTHTSSEWTPVYAPNSTQVVNWDVTFSDSIDNYPQGCFYYGAGGRLLASQVSASGDHPTTNILPLLRHL